MMGIALDALKIRKAGRAGIVVPIRAYVAAHRAGVPYFVACAFLERESGGGQNVFGHDPTIFVGAGQVTKEKYLAYRKKRGPRGEGGMQGVGPMQLTYWAYQDQADEAGGCWKPYANMLTGFRILAGYKDSMGSWHDAARAYNGSEEYAHDMDQRLADWRLILNG